MGDRASSSVLEMFGIIDAVATFANDGDSVLVYSDSESAVNALLKKYIRCTQEAQEAIVRFDLFIASHGITVTFKFIQREDPWIELCDSLSRNIVNAK